MSAGTEIDGVLAQWGDRLFYPRNRIVRPASTPRLSAGVHEHANAIRQRIHATVIRRAPQVMVKVTGGGRGMGAVAAHFRYISKSGRLPFEDDRGVTRDGKDAWRDLGEQWRCGGSFIEETSPRREAFNIMLSMPSGTDPQIVRRAAREFAQAELGDHRYVMVLHDHQANPHVHISVRAESRFGKRLNPRKVDLQRWRETFAEKLRGWGVDAEATRQRTRGQSRNYPPIWRVKAGAEGRLKTPTRTARSGDGFDKDQTIAGEAWIRIAEGLSRSDSAEDKALAQHVDRFLGEMFVTDSRRKREVSAEPHLNTRGVSPTLNVIASERHGPDVRR